MPVEDFETYTKVDEDGDITVTSTKIDVDTMRGDALSYVRRDKLTANIVDFEHKVKATYTSASADIAIMCLWGLSYTPSNTQKQQDDNNEGMNLRVARLGVYNGRWAVQDYNGNGSDFGDIGAGTFWCVIKRSGITFTCKMYSDEYGGALTDTLTFTCSTDAYRYIYGLMSSEGVAHAADTITGYIENLDLQEIFQVSGVVMFQDPAIV